MAVRSGNINPSRAIFRILKLSLPATDEHLRAPLLVQQLAAALAPELGGVPQIRFEAAGGQSVFPRMWERMKPVVDGYLVVSLEETRNAMRLMAEKARVILPITDPYVVHHGALGSFATTHSLLRTMICRPSRVYAGQRSDGPVRPAPGRL